MKTFALIALAGAASAANAQDLVVCVEEVSVGNWEVSAEFFGQIPGDATNIVTIWSDTSFRVSGDDAITFGEGWNPGYSSAVFGDPAIANDGTNTVEWVGLQPGGGLGSPDASNPLFVDDFTYSGDRAALSVELFGQNAALFGGDPAQPFGTPGVYLDALNNPGPFTFRVDIKPIPAPASAALLGLGGLAAARRRR